MLSSIPDAARSAKLYSALGYTYEQQKQYKNAIDAYRKAIELDRDNLDAIRGLAQNLMNDGQTDAALEQYKVIADANPEDAQTYLRMAEIYRKSGKFDLALESLKKAESMVQDSIEVPYNMAAVYQAQGRYDEAIQVLQDLLKKTEKTGQQLHPGREEQSRRSSWSGWERSIATTRTIAQAIETFRKMLRWATRMPNAATSRSSTPTAKPSSGSRPPTPPRKRCRSCPTIASLKMVYAAQLSDMGQADAGLQQVKSLLKGTPEDRDVYITPVPDVQPAEALAGGRSRLSTRPSSFRPRTKTSSTSTSCAARPTSARRNTIRRKRCSAKSWPTDPQNATALNYLGYMLADRGVKLDEALNLIKKAVDLDPANGAYLDSLGWAYFKLGKYELAEDNLTKASQHMGTDPTVQDHLGDLYQKTGRLKLAAAHWERAIPEWNKTVAAEVDNDDLAKVQKKLESAKMKLAKEDSENK